MSDLGEALRPLTKRSLDTSLVEYSPLVVYVLLATITSVPAFAKYTTYPLVFTSAYAAALTGIGLLISSTRFSHVERRSRVSLWLVSSALLAIGNAILYPQTRLQATPSRAPDALIEPARRLLSGEYPYAKLLVDGAPISPGPGWLAINAPLTVTGLIWLIMPLYLALAAASLARYGSRTVALSFTLLILAMPAFVQMSFVGHDLFAVGCAMVIVTLAVHKQVTTNGPFLPLWSMAAAVVASARAPLAAFIVVLGMLAVRTNFRAGTRFLIISGSTLAALHLSFYLWGRDLALPYQPLHVFGRAGNNLGLTFLLMAAAVSIFVTWALWKHRSDSRSQWLLVTWAAIGLPFVMVGLGELVWINQWHWIVWEGKVYVGFALPLLIAGFLLRKLQNLPQG